jgi:hypothetical protein
MIHRNYPYKGMKGRGVAIIYEDIQGNEGKGSSDNI